jgi:hypothetical protein
VGSAGNARVGLGRGNWDASLFVDNLTNEVALISANDTSFQFNIPQVVRRPTSRGRREFRSTSFAYNAKRS